MKVYKYKSKKYDGFVKVEFPGMKEKYKYVKESGYKQDKDGKIEITDTMDAGMKIFELLGKHIKEVSIKINGEHIKDWDELQHTPFCEDLINEITGFLMGGSRLGEVSKVS